MLTLSKSNLQLLIVVFAQFAGTSLWFAGNAVLPELQSLLRTPELTSWITSSVQIGFITGTLFYALLALPDRFRSTPVFLVSVCLAAIVNLGWLALPLNAVTVLVSRFLTGFFLAGVYPVGMKIAADRFKQRLSQAMGLLVGALVLGTAFPHLIRGMGASLPYRTLMTSVSLLAISGGLLLAFLVPSQSTYIRNRSFRWTTLFSIGKPSPFRPSILGYFGHMWELYTLWAFLPILISYYNQRHPDAALTVPLWTFGTIAAGVAGCVGGGYWALYAGSSRVARLFLCTSGLCIVLTPFMLTAPPLLFGVFLLIWGATAAGDSPQFSSLIASGTVLEKRGSTLTLVTCLGFLLTVLSIQLMAWLVSRFGVSGWLFYGLLPGPVFGLWAMLPSRWRLSAVHGNGLVNE